MNQTFTINLIWGLIPFLGIIISGAFWLNNSRNRIANTSIHSIALETEGQANSTDRLPISHSDPERASAPLGGRDWIAIIDAHPDDDDTEPPYIGWFY